MKFLDLFEAQILRELPNNAIYNLIIISPSLQATPPRAENKYYRCKIEKHSIDKYLPRCLSGE